ncbi:HtaA domain-containing protein [Amycolatopsis sp. 195334CR]|uniref:HtaA domain-containing protein n=1 Tax=Amycolatopsis sp. 195334CR TaxID=2814588 RepID=UPI001A8DB7C0|nr:HtaA domain-containing protein [Amycolatopsis sp. 195334CR]MBN6039573.1 HtaA domain-containing protein [Amycolatopsis sp. 195334CR]
MSGTRRLLAAALCLALSAVAVPAVAQAQAAPKVTVTPSAELDPAGTTVTIRGTGFDPAANDGAGYGVRVGPALATLKDPGTAHGFQVAKLVKKGAVGAQVPLVDDGSFEFTATVKSAYDGSDGIRHDAAREVFSVHTFGWRSPETTWDVSVPLAFKGIVVTPPPTPGGPGLYWGFKKSWRGYVKQFAGSTALDGGVIADPDPRWTEPRPHLWPVSGVAYDPGTGGGSVSFAGSVHYSVPSHFIWDIGIANPKVTFGGNGKGTLTATVNYALHGTKEAPQKVQPPTEAVLADLSFAGAPVPDGANLRATITAATLTEAGASAFDGFYQPGAELDAGAVVFESAKAPSVNLGAASVARGGSLAVAGSGFAPGESVALTSEAPAVTATADAAGAFAAQVAIPAGLRLGEHSLTATGAVSQKPASGKFTVTDAAAPALTLSADSVVQGGSLTANGTGFAPGESVALTSEAPEVTAVADATGAFSATIIIPPSVGVGAHLVTATGAVSQKPVTAAFTVTAADSACVLEPGAIAKGELVWGFKKSFRQYLGNGAGNSITAANGAEITSIDAGGSPHGVATGAHRYAFGSGTLGSTTDFTAQYQGSVTFAYPSHHFTLILGNPKVVRAGDSGTLFMDVELKTTDPSAPGKPTNQPGVALADLDFGAAQSETPAGALSLSGVKVTLTAADAFAGFYQQGTELDELSVSVGAACSTLPSAGGGTGGGQPGTGGGGQNLVPPVAFRPSLASTGFPGALLAGGGLLLLLLGAALLVLSRKRGRVVR